MVPKFHLLYFKNLLDIAFIKFFDKYNQSFIKVDQNYILMDSFSRQKIQNFFIKIIIEQLKNIVKPYDIIKNPDWYLIIGACNPKDNLLLQYKNQEKYFPNKLNKILSGSIQIKYFLKEQDIKIDIIKFNQVCLDVFNIFFSTNSIQKKFGNNFNNIIFITHKNLDCYSMFKVLKFIFGKSNCVNIYKEYLKNIKSPIISINDIIDKYITNKILMNKDLRFKSIVKEIQQFIELKIGFKK